MTRIKYNFNHCVTIIKNYLRAYLYYFVAQEYSDAGKIGLAITQSMMLTGVLQMGTKQITEAVNNLTSVERILEYTKLEQEPSDGNDKSKK